MNTKYNLEEILKTSDAVIVDVRTVGEFMGGHVSGSINIPLDEIPSQIEKLKSFNPPIVMCCASGNRSGQAVNFLSQVGIESVNGGSWLDVNYFKNQTV
jgi:phage shock protein E